MVSSMHLEATDCPEQPGSEMTSKQTGIEPAPVRTPTWGLQSQFVPGPKAVFDSVEDLASAVLPVMQAVSEAIGRNCEVVLHDLSKRDLSHSVYAIYNGLVSRRAVGSPSTNLGLEALRDEAAEHDEFGYTSRSSDGRTFRSSSVYYRNSSGEIIAALCINYDLTPLQQAGASIDGLLQPGPDSSSTREVIAPDISRVLEEMVNAAIKSTSRTPAAMDKNDRVQVMAVLERQGAFTVKRSVDQVAARLGISKVTAYGYLEEARRNNAGPS